MNHLALSHRVEARRRWHGVVYRAEGTHLDQFVAIKVLPPEEGATGTELAPFFPLFRFHY